MGAIITDYRLLHDIDFGTMSYPLSIESNALAGHLARELDLRRRILYRNLPVQNVRSSGSMFTSLLSLIEWSEDLN